MKLLFLAQPVITKAYKISIVQTWNVSQTMPGQGKSQTFVNWTDTWFDMHRMEK